MSSDTEKLYNELETVVENLLDPVFRASDASGKMNGVSTKAASNHLYRMAHREEYEVELLEEFPRVFVTDEDVDPERFLEEKADGYERTLNALYNLEEMSTQEMQRIGFDSSSSNTIAAKTNNIGKLEEDIRKVPQVTYIEGEGKYVWEY